MTGAETPRQADRPQRPPPQRAEGASLGDLSNAFIGMLRRRYLQWFAVSALLAALSIGYIATRAPKYEAETLLQIDPSLNPMAQAQPQGTLSSEVIETEVSLLASPQMARAVIDRLNLLDDTEFGGPPIEGETAAGRKIRVTQQVMNQLGVRRDKLSYVISVRFWSEDAEKAARIANAYADAYMSMRASSQIGTAERQAEFFRGRLAELAERADRANRTLADYRARQGITGSAIGTATDEQMAALASQLATAEAQMASARSDASMAREQSMRGELEASASVRSSPVIADLRRQRAEIMRTVGEIDARYGLRHPQSIKAHQQLDDIDAQIQQEANRVIRSVEAEASAASAKVAAIRAQMSTLQSRRAGETRASAEADRLAREAESARVAYDRMSALSLDSTQSAHGGQAQAEVINEALPPHRAKSPGKKMLLALAILASVASGFAFIVLLEMLQGGLRSIEQIEARFGLPVLSSIPAQKGKGLFGWRRRRSPADDIGSEATSVYSEAIRNLRLSIFVGSSPAAPTVIAMTSALPEEGKTTTSLALARMCAISGTRTLLIDCDVRNADLRSLIGHSDHADLLSVLSGGVSLADALVDDQTPGLKLLPVNSQLFTAEDLFGGNAMANLIAEARESFDVVLLDLPPLLGLADGRVLAALADVVVFVVRWGKTPAKAIEHALTQLAQDGTAVAGVVFSMVDPRSEAVGGMYYSSKYKKYYSK